MDCSRKRKRVITACVECYRRKQKCDRKHPCNICSARNVACSYLDSLYGPPGPLNALETPGKRQKEREEEQLVEEVSKPLDLSDQVGYSHRTESNALKALEKSLPGQTTAGPRDKSLVVRYLKEKFFDTLAALPASEITDELVQVFFVEANPHVGVLDQYFFRKALASWKSSSAAMDTNLGAVSRDVLYFPAVLFQVLAVALQYVPLDSIPIQQLDLSSYVAIDDISQKYSQLGLELMKVLGRHSPTIMSVQHDLMRAFWLKNCSRGTETWYILGDAIRQAQDLGLHLRSDLPIPDDHKLSRESVWYDEWKKRLWVSLFNWDAHMALVLGRPRSIHASDCTIGPPLDCNMPASPQDASPVDAMMSETPSLYTRHLFNNFISHKTHEMLSLGANRRYVKDYGIVKRLQDEVLQKLEELSPTSRPSNPDTSWDGVYQYLPKQREHILTFAYSFLVALHRPHTAVHQESRRMATMCSLATLESQQRLFDMMPSSHYRSFGTSFYTIDAGLFCRLHFSKAVLKLRFLLEATQLFGRPSKGLI
jgi:Fungal specific transcription factor domain/Fungal Zn(2)-Cys(6) binuclear cluster domain